MTPREYLRYTDELKANGYEYRKDCPYEGRNRWVKFPNGDKYSLIYMDVYHGFNADGEEYYTVRPYVSLGRPDCECRVSLNISFDTTNIVDIESMFEKYVRMMDGETEFVEAKK